MQVTETALKDVKLVRPQKFGDERGWFAETFNLHALESAGLRDTFVQDNQSFSSKGVLRGLHFQTGKPQGKLVRVLAGHIWDVAVDIRPRSSTLGQWVGVDLHDSELDCLWVPKGFAHGFLVLSETATVLYKTTDYYYPQGERCIRWDDKDLDIQWPLANTSMPVVSAKDALGRTLSEFLESGETPY